MIFVIIGAILGLAIGQEYRKPCLYGVYGFDTSITYTTSLDEEIEYVLVENQSGCEINLSGLYTNLSTLYTSYNSSFRLHRKELDISLKITCTEGAVGNEIHFNSSLEQSINQSKVQVAVQIVLRGCSLFVNELQVFKNHGRIWSILHTDSIIHPDSDCSSLAELQNLKSRLPCDRNNRSPAVWEARFFWEFCSKPFEGVSDLMLQGCSHEHYEIKHDLLQHLFPNLQTLNLKYVNLTKSLVTFPWTNVYIHSPEAKLITYISSSFASDVKNTSSLERQITISSSDVNISNVKFIGDIYTVRLNSIHLKSLNDNTFRNISGLTRLDLSYNELETINQNLFKMLTNLKYLQLGMNKLTVLHSEVFNWLHNLLRLDLSHNKIKILNQGQFKNLMKLEYLNLESNNITELPDDFLKDQVHSIKKLTLSSNPLEKIPVYPLYAEGIRYIYLEHCRINSSGFQTFIDSLSHNDLHAAYVSADPVSSAILTTGSEFTGYFVQRAVLSLSFNRIENIETLFWKAKKPFLFLDLLYFFYVVLRGNPIDCTCMTQMPYFLIYINLKTVPDATLIPARDNWKCEKPLELKGRLVISVLRDDIYCPISIENCPERCSCFERGTRNTVNKNNKNSSTIIVDCRNINITRLPEKMPSGKLELWFQNTSLTQLTARDYFRNTSVLDASHNRINLIKSTVAVAMANFTSLKLDHNNLTSLPVQIMSTNIRTLTLADNPFICDCHTRWMKPWLRKRTSPVTDWKAIQCSYNRSIVSQLIIVPESFFVCQPTMSISQHIIFPSVVTGCILFVLVSISLLIYFQRFTIKVLLFKHFGIHSFDKQKHDDANMEYDAFVLYSQNDSEFVSKNIIETLIKKGYTVCDLYEDLVVGFTFIDNIEHMVNKSRKIIFTMTNDTLTNNLLMSVWNIAYEKGIDSFTDSVILVLDNEVKSKCENDKLRKYIRSGKFIKKKSNLLQSSILYLMPKHMHIVNDNNLNRVNTDDPAIPMIVKRNNYGNDINSSLVYMSHPEEHDEEIRNTLIPELQINDYDVRIYENAFIPGTDIRDEIDETLEDSEHFIFILSQETLLDDVKMFILSTVISKSVLSNDNYLLLFTSGFIDYSCLPNEIENYLNKYVTASIACPEFKGRLLKALGYRL
ncbi:toll-like receptor 3 [Mercenaria mercenaria]|uniref:toll-like receptor 3 n=1 Tax=Mercenaria mercenaria TaxID=6596 RepID=UPI00234EDAD7|nr:toll-like receptor 3 [Mercenaria mercenaria]